MVLFYMVSNDFIFNFLSTQNIIVKLKSLGLRMKEASEGLTKVLQNCVNVYIEYKNEHIF